jgi:hypothetical protein
MLFDIIVGNPPYIRVQQLDYSILDYCKSSYRMSYEKLDISILFFEQALKLLSSLGVICYISSKQFLTSKYGTRLREYFLENTSLKIMIDFGELQLFQDRTTYVSIFLLNHSPTSNIEYSKVKDSINTTVCNTFSISYDNLTNDSWLLVDNNTTNILNKILCDSYKLSDVANSITGVITGCDSLLMFDLDNPIDIECELLLPLIRPNGISRFGKAKPTKKVVYPYYMVDNDTSLIPLNDLSINYPKMYNFIIHNEYFLKNRKDSRHLMGDRAGWYGLVRQGRLVNFNQTKIVTPGEVCHNKFCIDYTGSGFSCARVFGIIPISNIIDIYYLLGILNSDLCEFYLHKTASQKAGGYYTYSANLLELIPIKIKNQETLISIVKNIMQFVDENKDTTQLENQLNYEINKIYDLTNEEIASIKNEIK